MNSAPDSSYGLDSSSPLELALDRAMDRYWAAEETERLQRQGDRAASAAHAPAALVVTSGEAALATLPARLQWRGIDVSEEFQRYAARVARGEELAPYRGQVLARYCPDFPWGAAPRVPARRTAASRLERSVKIGAMLLSAGTALLAAIGVGSGGAAPVDDELEGWAPAQNTSALRPAPYVDEAVSLASVDAAEHVTESGDPRAKARTKATRSRKARSAPLRRTAAAAAASAPTASLSSNATSEAGATASVSASPEETFGLDELGSASLTSEAAKLAVGAAPPHATKRANPAAVSGQRSAKTVPRVGEPSDWDPTGKMSILFSDDLPF